MLNVPRFLLHFRPGTFLYLHGGVHDIPEHGEMREKIEILEYQAKDLAHLPQLPGRGVHGSAVLLPGDGLIQIGDAASVHRFQEGGAAEQSALAGAGGTDDRNDFPLLHGEGDILQHRKLPEGLADALHIQYLHLIPLLSDSSSASSRSAP